MTCGGSTVRETRTVWSDGTTTALFVPFRRFRVDRWRSVRVSIIMEGSSGSLTVDAAALYGNLDSDFDGGTTVDLPATPTTLAANGQAFGASYRDLDPSYQMLEIGVNAYNGAGTKREMAMVTLIIDFET